MTHFEVIYKILRITTQRASVYDLPAKFHQEKLSNAGREGQRSKYRSGKKKKKMKKITSSKDSKMSMLGW